MRLADWDDRLIEAVGRHAVMPFDWAVSNCLWMMMDAVDAMTGSEPYAGKRGRPKTERGAALWLKRRGFTSVEDAVAAHFPAVPCGRAMRGDLVAIDQPDGTIAGGVVLGAYVLAKSPAGTTHMPRDVLFRYYAVR